MYLPAEWHQQAFVQLTWPHKDTDWAPVLADAIDCFCEIARHIVEHEPLIVVAQYPNEAKAELEKRNIDAANITFVQCPTNDTWARDHAYITCIDEKQGKAILNDFQFNGWGLKFAANHDNQINRNILSSIAEAYSASNADTENSCTKDSNMKNSVTEYTNTEYTNTEYAATEYANRLDFVFEGGSIESDGCGTLMVTTSCLLADNRNNTLTKQDIEQRLMQYFNAKRVLWIEHSWLAGDDTDGHIDTVARFCSPTSIAYVKCYDEADEHYQELQQMEQELLALRTSDGKPYTLFPLPLPDPCYDEDGYRLPATHANFLIINGAVLLPTYNQPSKDAQAIEQLNKAFPEREIIPVDCRVLILQHGSLHCSTMQYPQIQ